MSKTATSTKKKNSTADSNEKLPPVKYYLVSTEAMDSENILTCFNSREELIRYLTEEDEEFKETALDSDMYGFPVVERYHIVEGRELDFTVESKKIEVKIGNYSEGV